MPLEQVSMALQIFPHPPQLVGSVLGLMHDPLQTVIGAAQVSTIASVVSEVSATSFASALSLVESMLSVAAVSIVESTPLSVVAVSIVESTPLSVTAVSLGVSVCVSVLITSLPTLESPKGSPSVPESPAVQPIATVLTHKNPAKRGDRSCIIRTVPVGSRRKE